MRAFTVSVTALCTLHGTNATTWQWTALGEGCCHDVMNIPASKKLYDQASPEGGCENEASQLGGQYYTTFPNGWCTVLSSDAPCDSLDNQPGQCGSSGVGTQTYKFDSTGVVPGEPTYPPIPHATLPGPYLSMPTSLGEGCCHDTPNIPASKKLYDAAGPEGGCGKKAKELGGAYYTEFPTGWCTVLTSDVTCEALDNQAGQCGSTGVGAHTYKLAADPCLSLEVAIDSCARYFDQQEPCAGFFYVNDPACGPNEQKYSFSSTFRPQRGLYAYNGSLTSSDAQITPAAVQLVFHALVNHALSDGDSSGTVVGDYKTPAKACSDNAKCSGYGFTCSDPHCLIRFFTGQITYSLTQVASAMDELDKKGGNMVFAKQKQQRLPSTLPLSVEAQALIV